MSTLEKIAVVVPAYNELGIDKTLQGLYDQNRRGEIIHHFIVDNGSTDDTRARVEAFMRYHDDFPFTIVDEGEKGTGAASDTGFRTAIHKGYSLIARTDADTVPTPNWTSRIFDDFNANPQLQLLGGKSLPLHDEHYRIGDEFLLPAAVKAARVILSLKNLDPDYLKAVAGHNMATKADAYTATGGFVRSSIDHIDEDIDYSLKVSNRYGSSVIKIDPKLEVRTSMRRIRSYGLAGIALHHLFPEKRKEREKVIDVR